VSGAPSRLTELPRFWNAFDRLALQRSFAAFSSLTWLRRRGYLDQRYQVARIRKRLTDLDFAAERLVNVFEVDQAAERLALYRVRNAVVRDDV
jgi:hypothetical protein